MKMIPSLYSIFRKLKLTNFKRFIKFINTKNLLVRLFHKENDLSFEQWQKLEYHQEYKDREIEQKNLNGVR